MGMKDWFKRMQDNAEEKLNKAEDPQAQRDAKREQNARNVRRAASAMKIAQKGLKAYNDAGKKADEIGKALTQKTAEIAEKAQPIAGKVDEAASDFGMKIKGAFEVVKDRARKGAEAAGEQIEGKVDKARAEQAKKPSTGSGILDMLIPAVPETDATKPKDAPTPKKPNGPNAG